MPALELSLSDYYFPRAVWLGHRTCRERRAVYRGIRGFVSGVADEIKKRGYSRRVRVNMASEVSTELGPLKRGPILPSGGAKALGDQQ